MIGQQLSKTWGVKMLTSQLFGSCCSIMNEWLLGSFWMLFAQCCWRAVALPNSTVTVNSSSVFAKVSTTFCYISLQIEKLPSFHLALHVQENTSITSLQHFLIFNCAHGMVKVPCSFARYSPPRIHLHSTVTFVTCPHSLFWSLPILLFLLSWLLLPSI